MSQPSLEAPSLEDFIASINKFSVQEKYYKWQSYLQRLKSNNSQFYLAILEKFVESFPFNYTFWSEICDLAMQVPKTGKANAVRLYQLALSKNPRSINLWKSYLDWLKKEICKSDPGYLKKQYDRATKIIGNHYKAAFIFENFFELEQQPIKKYQSMKKALVSPLEDIDKIYDLIETYIQQSEELTFEVLRQLADEQQLRPTQSTPQGYQKQVRHLLKTEMRKLYEPSKLHVQRRYEFQSKLSLLDQYKPFSGNIEVWRSYINFIKHSGNPDFLNPIYQRALITNCDNESLWEEYFLHLEVQSDYKRALYLLRSHAVFFRNFSKDIVYYWIELEERDSHTRSRDLYLQLQKSDPSLDVFLRHIQMQIRYKEFLNAKTLFETVLTTFTSNVNIVAFVILQYADLSLKYFRDIDMKKMLRSYFDSYPFNEILFYGYLEFFIKYVQYKEGGKEGKEIFNQFLSVIIDGLRRALENYPDKYTQIKKIAKKYLRDYVTSIFSLKDAERKIKDMEIQVKRAHDQATKRPLAEEYRVQQSQSQLNYSPRKYRGV